jgi:signal transduction histidine kinase
MAPFLKIFFLALVSVVLFTTAGIKVTTANTPAKSTIIGPASDTLKALGLLVERNKFSNNSQSIKYAKIALDIALQTDSINHLVDAYKWIGKAYQQNQKDSSYYYYNLALNIADSMHLREQKVHIFYNLASLYSAAYNYKMAMPLLDSSIRLAESVKNHDGIANAYLLLGIIKYNIHDFENAKLMFDSALKVAQSNSMYKQMGVAIANLARYPYLKDTLKSLAEKRFVVDTVKYVAMSNQALFYLNKVNGVEEEKASIYNNLGYISFKPDTALYYYKLALNLALNANLPKVLFGTYNNMAYSYIDKKDLQQAESCLRDKAIPLAQQIKDYDWLASLYDTYADVCQQKGDYKKGLEFQKKAMKARKADNELKGSDQVRLLAALLEFNKKELKIKSDEKELLVKENRLKLITIWLVIAVLLIAASVFTTFILQQRNRARFQKEQIGSAKRIIEMEETEKGRTARELHDLTGQLVLGISGTIENIDFPDQEIKQQLTTRIKELGTSIRQISHRMNRAMIEHFTFSEMISGLCEDVQKLSKMMINLDMSDDFPDIPNELVLHFYRITQELLTNAGKYARESQVKIRVFAENGKLTLIYSDDGPGFNLGEKSKPSMGILNIFERAKLVGGMANLTSAPGKGTSWEITFPIDQQNNTKS